MKTAGYHILRVGMAITFLWIGILIFREPIFWSGFLPAFVVKMFDNVMPIMTLVAIFDLLIGLFLLFDWFTFWIALLGFSHLLGILLLTGIDDTTVRDIGLAAASLALAVEGAPATVRAYFKHS